MKRWDLFTIDGEQAVMDGCSDGKYVLYDDIKDDRKLLEEAKGVLEKIYDKRFSVVAFLDYNKIKDFLTRAKGVLK